MITMNQLRVLPLLLSVGLSACAANTETPAQQAPLPAVEESKSLLARSTTPAITAPEYGTFAKDRNTVAIALYKQIAKGANGNIVYSPHSVATALAMTYAGSAGTTKSEIAKALSFTQSDAVLHAGFNQLTADLSGRGAAGGKGADGGPFRFNVANGLFAARTLDFKAPFLDALALNYGAGVKRMNYAQEPEAARAQINQWVLSQTEGEIKDLLARGTVTGATRLTLVNAVYMNAAWAKPFNPVLSLAGAFEAESGRTQVKYMRDERFASYAKVGDSEMLELPYDQSGLSMLLVLPKAGPIAAAEMGFSDGDFHALVAALASRKVNLLLPKFRIAGDSVSLKESLGALGVKAAFGDADFSAMVGEPLVVSDVIHKAMIDVGEKGTVAAAATAVVAVGSAAPVDPPIVVSFDRPFLFAVRDQKSGVILFMGRVAVPSLP